MSYQDSFNAQYLSDSLSNLSSSRSTNSLIVRTYKQATQLYLTKRFKEALEALEPIISTQRTEHLNDDVVVVRDAKARPSGAAPVAQSSRSTRTKVWVFYLSLLHAIIDLGQEEGKNLFGSARWRELASKARDGSIWEEVVNSGYGGNEGEIDADVVVNLATLLLGHMQNQKLNQQRLEMYLSISEGAGAHGHLSWAQDGMSTPMSNSSSSPKSLLTRQKILELYTLHVLPANEEWEYSRSFIEMNEMLDEERKEAFLNALQTLKDEKDGTKQRERELAEEREREIEEQRIREEARQNEEARKAEERHKATIEKEPQRISASNGAKATASPAKPPVKPTQPKPAPSSSSSSRSAKPHKKPPAPPSNFYRRASSVFGNLQQLMLQAGRNMNLNFAVSIRLLMFVVGFLLIIARRDLRLKIKRALEDSWFKLKQTVGMGVKVSYV